jgi:hypothetical protein
MKAALAIVLTVVSLNTLAYSENPHQSFDMTNNATNQVTITFRPVKNVQAECEKESRSRGLGGFGYGVEACSFWDRSVAGPDTCTIVTSTRANFHTIGHEVRHCIQGNFHK